MGNTKRERRNRKFKFNVNRKRLGKIRKNTGAAASAVPIVNKAWEESKSIQENLSDMGLSYDPNLTLKIPKAKETLRSKLTDHVEMVTVKKPEKVTAKGFVVEELEANATALRETKFELPTGQVRFLSYLIRKYGDDYKAMARDNKNIYQETWKKLRSKIRTFQSIPAQWNA